MDALVLLRGEDMIPDRQVILVAVDELEREHPLSAQPRAEAFYDTRLWPWLRLKPAARFACAAGRTKASVPTQTGPSASSQVEQSGSPWACGLGRSRLSRDRPRRWLGLRLPAECIARIPKSGAASLPCARAFAG